MSEVKNPRPADLAEKTKTKKTYEKPAITSSEPYEKQALTCGGGQSPPFCGGPSTS